MIKLSDETLSLSQALYFLDPMHTLCKVNENSDEYDEISEYILNRLDFNQDILSEENKEILDNAFDYYFETELLEQDYKDLAELLEF